MDELDTAIILAGGRGTRLGKLTEEMPKPMLRIKGKPILQHMIEQFSSYGVKKVILAIHYKKEKIIEYFGDGKNMVEEIIYSEEKEPLGTGGPLKLAETHLNRTFVFANGDTLFKFDLSAMIRFHKKNNAQLTIALKEVEDPRRFGVAELSGDRITKFIEKPKVPPSNLINAGVYIVEPSVLKHIRRGKFCSFEMEVIPKLIESGRVFGYKISGPWIDAGLPETLKLAEETW